MIATHIIVEGKTRRQIDNACLRAMSLIEGCSQGSINNPFNLSSSRTDDGRMLIKRIHEDGYILYNDGWYIVEVDDYCLYVDITSFALKELGNIDYKIIDTVN